MAWLCRFFDHVGAAMEYYDSCGYCERCGYTFWLDDDEGEK